MLSIFVFFHRHISLRPILASFATFACKALSCSCRICRWSCWTRADWWRCWTVWTGANLESSFQTETGRTDLEMTPLVLCSVTSSLMFSLLCVLAALAGLQSDHRGFHPGSCSGWTQRKPGDDLGSSPLHCCESCWLILWKCGHKKQTHTDLPVGLVMTMPSPVGFCLKAQANLSLQRLVTWVLWLKKTWWFH